MLDDVMQAQRVRINNGQGTLYTGKTCKAIFDPSNGHPFIRTVRRFVTDHA